MSRPKDPDILVDLTTARTEFEAQIIVRALEARGIPAHAQTTAGSMLQWEVAVSQPLRVAVRRRDHEQAVELLKTIRAESGLADWSTLDPGQPAQGELTNFCFHCGYPLTGLPEPVSRCPECGKDLKGNTSPAMQAPQTIDAFPTHPLARPGRFRRNRNLILITGLMLAALFILARLLY